MGKRKIALPPAESTRLVTIVAHVDHGKTSLADVLITSNGIISERLAGSLRYLDSTEEEQRRGITMHASAIGLRHDYKNTSNVIHLIDSPGHVDFCQEVTSSLMACDGALVVVDAVEGMGARLHAVLRETYSNELVPILVINKIDRLCTEMQLTKAEAYLRVRGLLESVNAACAAMIISKEQELLAQSSSSGNVADVTKEIDTENSDWNFDPVRGNVIFASALHNWGFSVPGLARLLFKAKTLPIKPKVLKNYLWGDYKYNSEKQKVFAWKQSASGDTALPMFAEFGLGPIWDIYNAVQEYSDAIAANKGNKPDNAQRKRKQTISISSPGIEKLLSAIKCGNSTAVDYSIQGIDDLQKLFNSFSAGSNSNEEGLHRAVLRRFRSLSDSVLDSVCDLLPSPVDAAKHKRSLGLRFGPNDEQLTAFQKENYPMLYDALRACSTSSEEPTVAHICKFMAVAIRDLSVVPSYVTEEGMDKSTTVLVGLARVMSGILRSEDVEYNIYGPPDVDKGTQQPSAKSKVHLFLIMGSSLVAVEEVPAGHICAVSNVDDLRWRTLTLCDKEYGVPVQGVSIKARPLVKVNVEACIPSETGVLESGLVRLGLADASVNVTLTKRGEHLLAALGELHLENALRDLVQVFCEKRIEIRTSEPIVEFGEGSDWFDFEKATGEMARRAWNATPPLRQVSISPYCDEEGLGYAQLGRCRTILGGKGAALTLRVIPLVRSVFKCVEFSQKSVNIEESAMEDAADEILHIGRAIGIGGGADERKENVSSILRKITVLTRSLDGNGNIMIESPAMVDGSGVFAVQSKTGEVYAPEIDKSTKRDTQHSNYNNGMYGDDDENMVKNEALATYNNVFEGTLAASVGLKLSDVQGESTEMSQESTVANEAAVDVWKTRMLGSTVGGFLSAMRAGPLCEEPIRGVMVIIEAVEIALTENIMKGEKSISKFLLSKPLSGGLLVSAIRQGVRCALLTRPMRLIEGYLRLALHSSLAGLGPLYNILSKRRGRVETDSMVDGTDLLLIEALLPQAEAFGLTQELLLKSSGEVTAPEMVFSHYEVLDEDPFWIPSSLEEREDYGEIIASGDSSTGVVKHKALTYLRKTRRRKGLMVDEDKIVKDGEKQRTMARKK